MRFDRLMDELDALKDKIKGLEEQNGIFCIQLHDMEVANAALKYEKTDLIEENDTLKAELKTLNCEKNESTKGGEVQGEQSMKQMMKMLTEQAEEKTAIRVELGVLQEVHSKCVEEKQSLEEELGMLKETHEELRLLKKEHSALVILHRPSPKRI